MSGVYSILEFGAVPDGLTDSSEAFGRALAQAGASGGGTVLVPPGLFLSGPIELSSDTTLLLDKDAVLRFLFDPERYLPVLTRWEGILCHCMHPLVFSSHARNVSIRGQGTLDGGGAPWWAEHRAKKASKQKGPVTAIEHRLAALNRFDGTQPSGGGGRETQFLRPPLVQFFECENVEVSGVTLRNSPFWTLHPVFCSGVHIDNVKIVNPPDAPNTDGIDIDSCTDVSIDSCLIDVGDDCIALKAGSGSAGLAEGRPTGEVTISHCTFLHGHGGVVIGSETAAGIRNVDVSNCRFIGSDRGIRLKSRRGRGGVVQNLSFRNLQMEGVLAPLTINLYYNCGHRAEEAAALFSSELEPRTVLTPVMRNIRVTNLVATDCRSSAGFVVGLPESPVENLSLENYIATMASDGLVPTDTSEMYQGLEATASRNIRLMHVNCRIVNARVDGVGESPYSLGPGARIS
jgi:polygalacturonase